MKFLLSLILMLHLINPMEDIDLIKVRSLYEQAAVKETVYLKLNNLLATNKLESNLLMGYNGANIMIGANYVFNPISKLNKFNKGKKLLEHAITKQPKSLELRYIRFTIQTNLPKFLGYSAHINIDKNIIINELSLITDVDLRNRIVNYLLTSKSCNDNDLKKVMAWKNK